MIFMQAVLITDILLQKSARVCMGVGVSGIAVIGTLGRGGQLEVRGDDHHGTLSGD